MQWDVVGLGNALMDALVVIDDDQVLHDLGLTRGIMHPVSHEAWSSVHHQFESLGVTLDSGGSCANTIATLGRLGANTTYCGQVGNDQLGALYADLIQKACGQHAIRFNENHATGKCLSIISKADAERTMVTDLGASIHIDHLGDFGPHFQRARIAHFTGYTLLDGPIQPVALEAIALAKRSGSQISLDVADPFVVGLIRELLWQVIDEYADIVFLNEEEAEALTGQPAHAAAAYIQEHARVETVVVKLGSKGSMVLHDGEVTTVPIKRVVAIDTTGAGDAYAGGLLYGMVQGWPTRQSASLASAVAAHTVAQIGAVVKDSSILGACVRDIVSA